MGMSEDDGPGKTVVRWLGRLGYQEALERQLDLVASRARDEKPDHLLLLEHPPVYTVGRGARGEDVPHDGVPVVSCSRGGKITWHGPGQLVGYWIRKLGPEERDLHAHLRLIEDRLIRILHDFGLSGERRPGLTGVWCRGTKVASLGVAVRNWVTYHGWALNVDVDLAGFRSVRPCGLSPKVMGDLRTLLDDRSVTMRDVIRSAARAFGGDEFSILDLELPAPLQ